MAKLAIHTRSGQTVTAPFEAWVVALINSLSPDLSRQVFTRVAQMDGASLLPDKYKFGEDALGTITMVERPTIDLGGRV